MQNRALRAVQAGATALRKIPLRCLTDLAATGLSRAGSGSRSAAQHTYTQICGGFDAAKCSSLVGCALGGYARACKAAPPVCRAPGAGSVPDPCWIHRF